MLEKIKSYLDLQKISFWSAWEMAYKASLNKMDFCMKNNLLTKIFSRPSEFINSNGDIGKPDFTTSDGTPIWVVELSTRDYVDAAMVIPLIAKVGLVAPFVTNVTNVATNENVGYMILMPDTFKNVDEKIRKFLIGHEIGHIENGHMSQIKDGAVSRKISREFEADLFGKRFAGIKDNSEMKRIFEEMFSIVFKTTFSSIERLEKYNNDEDIKFFINNWSPVQKRIRFLINNN